MSNTKVMGFTNTRIYHTWYNMIHRCYSPKNRFYKYYGAKGIDVCDEWRDNFFSFLLWALKNDYTNYLTLDRIDNSKGYSPENCFFSTYKQQENNKAGYNVFLTVNGVTHTLGEWSTIANINYMTLYQRYKRGCKPEECISKYKLPRKRKEC